MKKLFFIIVLNTQFFVSNADKKLEIDHGFFSSKIVQQFRHPLIAVSPVVFSGVAASGMVIFGGLPKTFNTFASAGTFINCTILFGMWLVKR